jgi:flagellar biogenesis protein FliO
MSATQIITFIAGSIAVILGAYFATYLVARGSQRIYRGRLIQVLDRFSLAKDKSLILIAVCDKIYLLAFSAGCVTLLDNIDPETIAALTSDSLKPKDKPRQPGNLITLIFSSFCRRSVKKIVNAAPGKLFPHEAYLSLETDGQNKPNSFFDILQNRLKKERNEEDNN